MTCDCCGLVTVDEVALLAIEDAVIAFRDAVVAKDRQDKAAWAEAERVTQLALAGSPG